MGMVAIFKILHDAELESITNDPDCAEEILFPEDVDDPFEGQYDIDKSWHAIHYLITGSSEPDGTPSGDAILGGRPVGSDLGYGPARLVEPEHAKRIAESLRSINLEVAYENLDRSTANEADVYLGFDFSEDEKKHLARLFDVVRDLYSTAASNDRAILLYLA